MARTYILQFEGGTTADYDWMLEEMQLGGQLPPGLQWHVSGPVPGGLCVIDRWESAEAMNRFAAEKIGPIADRRGMPKPSMESFEVVGERHGPLRKPMFAQIVRLPGLDAAAFAELDARIVPGDPPEGLVHHANGPYDGGWIVADTWTDRAIRDRFMVAQVEPNAAQAPLTGPPEIVEIDLHASMIERAPAHA